MVGDDLYNDDGSVKPLEPKDVGSEVTGDSDLDTDLGFLNFDFDFGNWVSFFNYFILAWMIIHTLINIVDFYMRYFKMAPNDNLLRNQKTAREILYSTLYSWIAYLGCLAMFYLFVMFENTDWKAFFGVSTLFAYSAKFFWFDFRKTPLMEIIKGEDNTMVGKILMQPFNIMKKANQKLGIGDFIESIKSKPKK